MPHRYRNHTCRIWTWLVLLSTLGLATAQSFTGAYGADSANGPVELELQQRGDDLAGVLLAPGVRFEIEGFVDDGAGIGFAYGAEGSVGFEAYLEGDMLGLYLFEVDANGDAVMESVIELILTRRTGGGGTGQSPVPPPPDAAPRDPFAAPDPFGATGAPTSVNPLTGTFADERLTLTVEETAPGSYRGVIVSGDREYPLDVYESREGLVGAFESGGQAYTFDAVLEGDVMVFHTAGNAYRLARVEAAASVDPFAQPPPASGPGPRAAGSVAGASSPVIARGAYGELRQDDALAFIEALEFVLQQIGYAYRFSDAERAEVLASIARSYPQGSQTDQVVLAQARHIWRNAQANWARTSAEEQREFALGVLVLAFGEATVRQWVGSGGGGGQAVGGGGSCTTFEDCTSGFVDERTWTDTFQAQGCWAAAGCSGYDSSTGTLTYDSYE